MIKNIAEIEVSLGLEAGKLTEMISSDEEHELDLNEIVVLPKATYTERIENIKKETSTTTKEILVKKMRNEFGLEFEGKTEDNLITAFKTKLEKVKEEAVTDPEKRYVDLKTDFEKLQSNFAKAEQEKTDLLDGFKKKEQENEIKSEFFKYVPDNTLVSKATIFTEATQQGFTFAIEDGKKVIKDSSGEIVKDEKTFSPLPYKDWVSNFVTPYLSKAAGGNGGSDEPGSGKAGSFEAFEKEAEKNGWNATQRNEKMQERIKNGTLKL
jgi:hypothetical protein